MVGLSGILDIFRSSDNGNRWKRIVSRLRTNQLKRSKLLMVDLMIILFHLKLEKFNCIGCYELVDSDLSFCSYKNELLLV